MGNTRLRKERVPADTIGTALPLLTVQTIFFLFVSLGPDGVGALAKQSGLDGGFLRFDGPLVPTSILWLFLSIAAIVACMLAFTALLVRQRVADRLVQVSGGLFGLSLAVFFAHVVVVSMVIDPFTTSKLGGLMFLVVAISVVLFVAYRMAVRMDRDSTSEPPAEEVE